MFLTRRALLHGLSALPLLVAPATAAPTFDVVVYGATPSGIVAAYAAAREGARVKLIFAGPFGGMMANGLGDTDVGRLSVIGGLAAELFRRNGKRYGLPSQRDFEPSGARAVFLDLIREAGVSATRAGVVDRVLRSARAVDAVRLSTGEIIRGRSFIDASYEGDLMARAGCAYRVGRESREEFQEPLAGFNAFESLRRVRTHDARGRPFALLEPMPNTPRYSADRRVQAYGFRVCLTDDPANRLPFPKPRDYDPDRYLFLISRLNPSSESILNFNPHPVPGGKFDLNGHFFGASHRWPDGSFATRATLWRRHYDYHAGLLHTLANDPRVPANHREIVNRYGLPKDEFQGNGHWPNQLYVREARRLRGVVVMRQQDVQTEVTKEHPIGLGSYSIDSHGTGLYIVRNGLVNVEGNFSGTANDTVPYQIPYECLLPREVDNLFVSVCVSATQVSQCSLRMEPQYMIMGEAAGCAAAIVAARRIRSIDIRHDIAPILRSHGVITHGPDGSDAGG